MARVKGGTISRARHKKVMKQAKGYFGSKHRLYRSANEQVMHSLKYAYRDRRQKKRDFRKLWITRINAACRMNGISYSKFINGLNIAGVVVNRKMLSEIAIDNPQAFTNLVEVAKAALNGDTKAIEKVSKPVATEKKEYKKTSKISIAKPFLCYTVWESGVFPWNDLCLHSPLAIRCSYWSRRSPKRLAA